MFDDDTVSLSTTERRVRCPLDLPDANDGYQRQYLDSDEWSVTESTLTARDGDFFLHIGFRRHKNDTERNTAEDGTVLGVDLGIENLAVTSTAYFFSGREIIHDLREFEKYAPGCNRPEREAPTERSFSRVVGNFVTSATFSTGRRTR